MKPLIPKEMKVPDLNSRQIEELTNIVFLPEVEPTYCDAIFVFAGTHPGHWEKAIEAYKKGYSQKLIVTGGVSPTGVKHPHWKDQNESEANVIICKLLENGIKRDSIVFENKSRNTLENVLFAKEVFDFSSIKSLLFVCKNHACGRQYRTLVQHIPNNISYVSFGFNAHYQGHTVSRDDWMKTEIGRARVFGEYLRILHYGKMGHIFPLEKEVEGLEEFSS
ncbi:YdcF family protein [Bacillus salitolerans]|uniref:YdcF family protein n=1 Tax=Bacillus salitolerans TaxID=1437434 RepID=A0ABW4LWB7_9BACI